MSVVFNENAPGLWFEQVNRHPGGDLTATGVDPIEGESGGACPYCPVNWFYFLSSPDASDKASSADVKSRLAVPILPQ